MAKKGRRVRVLRETLLITGEGAAEVRFIEHLRSTYTGGRLGRSVTIKDAGGKGASNVVNCAIRNQRNLPHDIACALLDTDQDWSPSVAARAKRAGVRVIAATPCLEALLLEIAGWIRDATSVEHKAAFEKRYGGPAHQQDLIARNFPRDLLDAARARVGPLDELLVLIGIPRPDAQPLQAA
jgi:hypothetical protein